MKIRFQNNQSRGFSLLEIVLALTIFALVLTAIYTSWIGILKASQVGSAAAADVQRSRIAMQTMEDSLSSARSFAADVRHYSFVGENGSGASLSFVARLPETFPRSGKFGDFDVRRVTFALETDRETGSQFVLRQNPILMDQDEDEQLHPIVLARNVKKFEMAFWDTTKKDWTEEWTQTNQLPLMVKVTLEFSGAKKNNAYNTPGNNYTVTRVVGLPSVMVAQSWQIPTAGGTGVRGVTPPAIQPGGRSGNSSTTTLPVLR